MKRFQPKNYLKPETFVSFIIFLTMIIFFSSISLRTIALSDTATPSTSRIIGTGNITQLSKVFDLSSKGVNPTWSPDGKKLAIIGETEIFIYSVADFNAEPQVLYNGITVDSVVFNLDGTLLAVGNSSAIAGGSSQIIVWDLSTSKQKVRLKKVYAPSFDPNDRFLLSLDADSNSLILWDLVTNKYQNTLQNSRNPVFSRDGKLLAVVDSPARMNSVSLWNLSTLTPVAMLEGKQDGSFLDSLSFSFNRQILAAGEDNGSIRLWDLKTLNPLSVWSTKCGQNVDLGVDITTLITWSQACDEKDNIQMWQFSTGKKLWGLQDAAVRSVRVGPDGSFIMVEDEDQIRFLDKTTGQEKFILQNANQPEFSPDGSKLVTDARDGTIQLWTIK